MASAASDATRAGPRGTPAVAVASSLRALWPELERAWREELPGVAARPTFGASLTLSRQIARGAPFELLLAADERSVAALGTTRARAGSALVYARGRLALALREPLAPADATGAGEAGAEPAPLARLARRLRASPALRVAIPNPTHAPYGVAAREALATAGIRLPPARLAVAENAAQTLQFLGSGAVDAALLPYPLARATAPPDVRVLALESALHAPIVHRLVALERASPAALALARWFGGARARSLFVAAGFDAPP